MLSPEEILELTTMLDHWDNGNEETRSNLMELVLEELRVIARCHLRKERQHHTLRTDGLINEVYLKLHESKNLNFKSKVHFFGVASNAMRQILVDYAREQATEKRGGRCERVFLEDLDRLIDHEEMDLLQLNDAIDDLARNDPRKAKIVVMRYFGGLTLEEVAEVENTSIATVKREWVTAKARLLRRIKGKPKVH